MALPHTTNILDYPARFQFGETGAPCGGKSCCTDTTIKMIVEYYKEKTYSLSEIRKRAQALTNFDESPCSGINHIEAINALKSFGIPYKAAWGVKWSDVWSMLDVGPVIACVYYGSYPNAKNSCGTIKAEQNGRTDCGFSGAHAVLVVGKRFHTVDAKVHRDFYVRDPDHASPARPEKPKYDIITASQLDRTMADLPKFTGFTTTAVYYPTLKKTL